MTHLLDVAETALIDGQWRFERRPEEPIIRLSVAGEVFEYRCVFQSLDDLHILIFYAYAPLHVPEAKRLVAAEYLTRANYGLRLGNYELDFTDGEVRYKTSIDCEGGELTEAMVRNLMLANLQTMDRYLPGLIRLVQNHESPAGLIAEMESPAAINPDEDDRFGDGSGGPDPFDEGPDDEDHYGGGPHGTDPCDDRA